MKRKTFLFTAISLFLLLGGVGCEEKLSETELMKQKITGTWEWTVSYQHPGFNWKITPIPEEKREITFIGNRVLITHNLEFDDQGKGVISENKRVLQDGTYIIQQEQDKFFIIITPKEQGEDLWFYSGKREISIDQDSNTLTFSFSQGTAHFSDVYKRINQ